MQLEFSSAVVSFSRCTLELREGGPVLAWNRGLA